MLGLVKGVVMNKTKQVLDLIKIRAGVDDAFILDYLAMNFGFTTYSKAHVAKIAFMIYFIDYYTEVLWQLVVDLAPRLWKCENTGEKCYKPNCTSFCGYKDILCDFLQTKESDRLDWLIENLV